jgi:curli biogenesis system outer membrane secretion channel CsgG
MKRILSLLLIAVLAISVLAGCGSTRAQSTASMDMAQAEPAIAGAPQAAGNGYDLKAKATAAEVEFTDAAPANGSAAGSVDVTSIGGGSDATQDVNNAILSETKVIRSANL